MRVQDAAIAVAAALNVTEPCSTGIGGDMFMLFWDAAAGQVRALNGSGHSASACDLATVRRELGLSPDEDENAGDFSGTASAIPVDSVHAITVPGAAAGWVDAVERFGSGAVDLETILTPAIQLAERGFPVSELTARYWAVAEPLIRVASPNFAEMLKPDPLAKDRVRAPRPGEIFKNPNLAKTFRSLAVQGKRGFYAGRVAEALVAVVGSRGGHLSLDDLTHHVQVSETAQPIEPISLKFYGQGLASEGLSKCKPHHGQDKDEGIELWEHPPNGQGIVALMALGIMQELERQDKIPCFKPQDFNTAPYLHAIIEALRLAVADGHWYIADPAAETVPVSGLLSQDYLSQRAQLFDATRAASGIVRPGQPPSPALRSCDTVYFAVTDSHGNAASVVNSNYCGFGTCIIPRGCGFTLQNRGSGFSLSPKHPNSFQPRKRPYHTIIPGMVTNTADGSLHSTFGVMGGFMQPQGHVQVLLGQLVGRLDPQQALDAPRICIGAGMPEDGEEIRWTVNVEEGMPQDAIQGLKQLGHNVKVIRGMERSLFGRGQIIRQMSDPVTATRIWSAGSDMRADGAAFPC
ncbi:hypothetical protein CDD82_4114 [Ophiocordyceps australis]|uniref:Gamma-glutamyltransferase n=1 Tax=Ophiocordyceps australis TaxID=1399860 RepID=A0A2C5Z9T6_9HYPO|nr:hypothetical protein CDD82_4114 [Ophiocordyceps australis]